MEFGADRSHAVLPTRGPNQDQFGHADVPTQFDDRRWRKVVRYGESWSAYLSSGRRPDTEATLFSVTPLAPDWKQSSPLGRTCTAALEGPQGAMHAELAQTRNSFDGFMGGLGQHEWIGGKHDPGRRNGQYASGLLEPDAAAYHKRMQRNTMPELTTGTPPPSRPAAQSRRVVRNEVCLLCAHRPPSRALFSTRASVGNHLRDRVLLLGVLRSPLQRYALRHGRQRRVARGVVVERRRRGRSLWRVVSLAQPRRRG